MRRNRIRLSESHLHRMISESVKRVLNESQESLYQQFCNLEEDLKTVIANTDSSSNPLSCHCKIRVN